MTEQQVDLARRAVACKGWRWMYGMLTTCDLRVIDGVDQYVVGHRSAPTKDGGGWYDGVAAGLLPDLTDPATLGCLLALVREVSGGMPVFVIYSHERGTWIIRHGRLLVEGRTEAESLVAALENAR
jgi:hypothetical protein